MIIENFNVWGFFNLHNEVRGRQKGIHKNTIKSGSSDTIKGTICLDCPGN